MTTLLIAEHNNQILAANILPLVSAATELQNDIVILIAGQQCQAVADKAAKIVGVSKVILVDNACYKQQLAESMATLIQHLAPDFAHIIAPASTFGKNILARAAALLDINMFSDVIEIINPTTFKRPIYAGNAIVTVESLESKQLLTIRTTAFNKADVNNIAVPIEALDFSAENLSTWLSAELTKSDRPELTEARVIVSGGRGLQSEQGFQQLTEFADHIGAAIGASRAAVDAGYAANDLQVGQTGKIVAPEVYIAFGISGAVQHLAGIKDSKTIFAIDKDPEAPIFQTADYGLVADVFTVLEQLIEVEKI